MKALAGLALVVVLAGCADFGIAAAAERRQLINDLQAEATRRAVCDISLGAHLRGSPVEQEAERALCDPARSGFFRLEAIEP